MLISIDCYIVDSFSRVFPLFSTYAIFVKLPGFIPSDLQLAAISSDSYARQFPFVQIIDDYAFGRPSPAARLQTMRAGVVDDGWPLTTASMTSVLSHCH